MHLSCFCVQAMLRDEGWKDSKILCVGGVLAVNPPFGVGEPICFGHAAYCSPQAVLAVQQWNMQGGIGGCGCGFVCVGLGGSGWEWVGGCGLECVCV